MIKPAKILLSASLLLSLSLSADVDNGSNKIDKIATANNMAQAALSPDGYVSKSYHSFFWKQLENATPDDLDKLKMVLIDMPHLQLMIWRSVEQSAEKHREVYVAGLLEELKRIEGLNNYVIPNTRAIIKSAAQQKPFNVNGEEIVFTIDMAKQFVDDWKTAEERGIALYDANFNFTKTKHKLTDTMNLNSVFTPSKNNVSIMYGLKQFKTNGFSTRLDQNAFILVSETAQDVKNIKKGTRTCVDGFFRTMGDFNEIGVLTKDEGSFGLDVYPARDTGKTIYTAVSCEYRNNKVYSIMVTTDSRATTLEIFKEAVKDLTVEK